MTDTPKPRPETPATPASEAADASAQAPEAPPPAAAEEAAGEVVEEIGGPAGPDPTRFGDWERKGRCIDF